MIHRIDKEAVKRIVYLRQVQGLSFPTIAERFGISSARTVQIFKRQQKKKQDLNVKPENLHVRIQKHSHAANFKHHEFVKNRMRKKSSTKNQVEENTVKIGRFVARLAIAAFLLAVIIYSLPLSTP